jgi:hypothetical protein
MYIKIFIFITILFANNAKANLIDRWIAAGEYPGLALSVSDVSELQASTGSDGLVKDSDPIGCILVGNLKLYLESNRFGPSGTSVYIIMQGDNTINCIERKINFSPLNELKLEIRRIKLIPTKNSQIFSRYGIELFKKSEFSCFDKTIMLERGQSPLLRGIKACKFKGAISGYLVILTEGS